MLNNQTYKEWLAKANEDMAVGEEILGMGHFLSPACFHFQQAAEKYLKAMLVFHNLEFSKTHDLAVLAKLLSERIQGMVEIENELQILARYSVETRYPGDYPEIDKAESKVAQTAVQKIADFVAKQKFNQ